MTFRAPIGVSDFRILRRDGATSVDETAFVADYEVRSNRESGSGRCDAMVAPSAAGRPGVVMELKVARDVPLERALEAAARQLRERPIARPGATNRSTGSDQSLDRSDQSLDRSDQSLDESDQTLVGHRRVARRGPPDAGQGPPDTRRDRPIARGAGGQERLRRRAVATPRERDGLSRRARPSA